MSGVTEISIEKEGFGQASEDSEWREDHELCGDWQIGNQDRCAG